LFFDLLSRVISVLSKAASRLLRGRIDARVARDPTLTGHLVNEVTHLPDVLAERRRQSVP
jgi:hypothetical protein